MFSENENISNKWLVAGNNYCLFNKNIRQIVKLLSTCDCKCLLWPEITECGAVC